MTPPTFTATMPILRIFDEALARGFYLDWLGFAADWEHRFDATAPLYMQIRRAGLVLHLSGHYGDATPGATVFIPTLGLAAFHAELCTRPNPHMRPGLEPLPWGTQMQVTDPFGNRLRFCEMTA